MSRNSRFFEKYNSKLAFDLYCKTIKCDQSKQMLNSNLDEESIQLLLKII